MSQTKYAQYKIYKDSEVGWIGKVPEHWEYIKLSQSFSKIGSGTTPKSGVDIYYEKGTTNWINTGDLNDGILESCKRKITKKALQDHVLNIYPVGSIIIAMYGATIGKVSISMMEACTNQACCVLYGSKTIDVTYMFYWFLSKREFIISLSYGGGQPNISQDTIKSLRVLSPTLLEQTAIVIYLDTKTAQIDRKIELLSQKATQYVKLKQSLINETVTHGLDKTVAMKDSGVEWIGNIPAHWEVQPIRKLLENRVDKNAGNIEGEYLSLVAGIGVIPYAEKGNIGNKRPENLEKCKMVYPGDFVLNSMNFGIGSFGISRYKGVCSSVYIVMRPKNADSGEFLYRIFQVKPFQLFMSSFGKGIMEIRMAIKWIDLKNIHIPYPPISEQQAIANYLDEKTAQIDRIVTTLHAQIDRLKELRKTLINDVVTGKIKVVKEG